MKHLNKQSSGNSRCFSISAVMVITCFLFSGNVLFGQSNSGSKKSHTSSFRFFTKSNSERSFGVHSIVLSEKKETPGPALQTIEAIVDGEYYFNGQFSVMADWFGITYGSPSVYPGAPASEFSVIGVASRTNILVRLHF